MKQRFSAPPITAPSKCFYFVCVCVRRVAGFWDDPRQAGVSSIPFTQHHRRSSKRGSPRRVSTTNRKVLYSSASLIYRIYFQSEFSIHFIARQNAISKKNIYINIFGERRGSLKVTSVRYINEKIFYIICETVRGGGEDLNVSAGIARVDLFTRRLEIALSLSLPLLRLLPRPSIRRDAPLKYRRFLCHLALARNQHQHQHTPWSTK